MLMLGVLQRFDKFPKAIYFILCNTFLERLVSGGLFGERKLRREKKE
jgi:hypothetical protein